MATGKTNYDKLIFQIKGSKKPFIVYDVETTGIMNGNNNAITQIALACYDYNKENKCYELQDELFMLAKPDKAIIQAIREDDEFRRDYPMAYALEKLKDDYIYSLVKKATTEDEKQSIKESIDEISVRIAEDEKYYYLNSSYYYIEPDGNGNVELSKSFAKYCNHNNKIGVKTREVEALLDIEEVLEKQGLNLDEYLEKNEGLTNTEMQAGITEFISKYCKDDTVFVNNGTYFAKHYMDKVGLSFLGKTDDPDKVIDLIQAERSKHGGVSRWTSDIPTNILNRLI